VSKRVLITGISGFVGPHLAKYLLQQGDEVWGFTRRRAAGSKVRSLQVLGIGENVKVVEGDVTSISSLAHALDIAAPDVIFHLAAQSFVPQSFSNPVDTYETNVMGSVNLLEAVRLKDLDPDILFAGSSEEYGLAFASERQWKEEVAARGPIYPEPAAIPELPIAEGNPLRPMSPYGVSKVQADYAFRNYHRVYGMKTVVTRAFNHEGPGRGPTFVTSTTVSQAVKCKLGQQDTITLGNVNTFRDWSHVEDVVRGYDLIAATGRRGHVYNLASQRTNSVLSYALLALEVLGFKLWAIEAASGGKRVKDPTRISRSQAFGLPFEKTAVDEEMLQSGLEYSPRDKGVRVKTDQGDITIAIDPERYRPAEVPVLLGQAARAREVGFKPTHSLADVIQDQANYYLDARNREGL
jgi:GDPmannose 4,6-dehydratase